MGHFFYEELADTYFLGKTSIPMKSSLMEKGIGVILSMGVNWLHFFRTKSSELQHLTILTRYTMDECVLELFIISHQFFIHFIIKKISTFSTLCDFSSSIKKNPFFHLCYDLNLLNFHLLGNFPFQLFIYNIIFIYSASFHPPYIISQYLEKLEGCNHVNRSQKL